MLLCQISDLHLTPGRRLAYGVVDTATCLERCVQRIAGLDPSPDLVVATGDLVDTPVAQSYGLLREILAKLPLPVYLLPGNHDERGALRAAFPEHAYLRQWDPFVQYAIDDWPLRIVAIDTVIPGEDGGRLDDERLAWLEKTLSLRRDKPTLLIMHHPPFPTLIGHMDQIGLEGSDALARVIERHPQVERVLCGHLHRPIQFRFAGTIASTCPSPAHQVALDLAADAASAFRMEPPAFQLHAWRKGVGVVSHTAYIGDFAGPYPFEEESCPLPD